MMANGLLGYSLLKDKQEFVVTDLTWILSLSEAERGGCYHHTNGAKGTFFCDVYVHAS